MLAILIKRKKVHTAEEKKKKRKPESKLPVLFTFVSKKLFIH